ncbi:MAG: oligosaccharide flippase family protein [Actinomycetaceae bacterium]|nr:oligosaccharide flippase family protein [Actinomycetaceae bacterium]MDO5747034.1 oligosaccharide flippase family protein [Actinomycetaceae bacterium]
MISRVKIQDSKKRRLFKNTVYLYILVFSGYFFALITVPYQTRVLGPELFGKIGWAMATMTYFSLFIEFGYLISATEKIALHQEERKEIEKIVGAVTVNKLIAVAGGFAIILVLSLTWSKMNDDPWFFILCYFSAVIQSFMLDFFYRGIEQMQLITIVSVAIRAFFTVCIFIFLHEPADYWVVPALNLAGGLLAAAYLYYYMIKKLGYKFVIPDAAYCLAIMKHSAGFFYSRVASTVYTSTNIFLLGFVYPVQSVQIGAYTSADKLTSVMKRFFSPIADSLYPYMVKNKDFKLLKKMLMFLMPPIILGSSIIIYFATPLCVLVFGPEFELAGPVLQLMMGIVIITLPVYLLGFPTLSALGGAKAVNASVIVASVIDVTLLVALYLTGTFTLFTVVITSLITELIILIYRIVAIRYYWKRFNDKEVTSAETNKQD